VKADFYLQHGAQILADFEPGTLAFDHSQGWTDQALTWSKYHNTHSWTISGNWTLPPSKSRPGILSRHAGLLNIHKVRLLLFQPSSQIPVISTDHLVDFFYRVVGTGGHGLTTSNFPPFQWWNGTAHPLHFSWDTMSRSMRRDFLLL
jgi:hypothetical protein